jgi:hypothetical protein
MSANRYAGFAAVTTVGADFVNGMLAGAAALVPPANFALPSVVTIGGDSIGLVGSLSFNAPTVTFATNPQNLINATLSASGMVRFTANGGDLVEVVLTLSTSLQVGLFANVSPSQVALGIENSNAVVTAVDASVTFGPPLATTYAEAIRSGPVLQALTAAVRAIPQSSLSFNVPGVSGTLSYTFGGVNVAVPVSRVVIVPLDGNVGPYPNNTGGCLDVALDVAGYTNGDPSQLVNLITTVGPTGAGYSVDQSGNVNFAGDGANNHTFGGTNVATVVNVDFFTALVNKEIAPKVVNALNVVAKGVIHSLSVSTGTVTAALNSQLPTLQYNCLTANVSGSYAGASFNFSASFTPVSVEFDQPYSLTYSMWLVAYNWSVPALTFVNIFLPILFPWLGVIGDLIIDSTLDSFIANEVNTAPGFGLSGSGTLPYPGLKGWSLTYWVDDMAVSNSEIAGYILFQVVSPPSPPPVPVFLLSAPTHALTDPSPLIVSLQVNNTGLLDPTLGLRITWTAVRTDTGATVLNQDSPLTAAALTIAIDRWNGDQIYNNLWDVTCEVYRPADALTGRYTYFNQGTTTGVSDVVDRHHPYVRWDHTAWFHDPSGVGTLKQHPFWIRNRKSRIHRTDVLIRCIALYEAFTTGYPQETGVGLVELKEGLPTPQYLDCLADYGDLGNVEQWRHGVLCDYCFFGGPTRTTWKTPTPPTPNFE